MPKTRLALATMAAFAALALHRDEYGPFEWVRDLLEVDGFDERRVQRLEEHVTV